MEKCPQNCAPWLWEQIQDAKMKFNSWPKWKRDAYNRLIEFDRLSTERGFSHGIPFYFFQKSKKAKVLRPVYETHIRWDEI